MTIIYTLEHPVTEEIRYIGKTCQTLQIRLWNHKSSKGNNHRCKWIQSLLKQGLAPTIRAVEVVEGNGSEEEIYWIGQFKAWGFRLVNATDGGEGCLGIIRTQEWKDNIGKGNKGKKLTQEVKDRISKTLTGRKQSLELIKKRFANLVNTQIKPVYQYLNGELIADYPSAEIAAQSNNTTRANIRQCCLGVSKSAVGYQWKYN